MDWSPVTGFMCMSFSLLTKPGRFCRHWAPKVLEDFSESTVGILLSSTKRNCDEAYRLGAQIDHRLEDRRSDKSTEFGAWFLEAEEQESSAWVLLGWLDRPFDSLTQGKFCIMFATCWRNWGQFAFVRLNEQKGAKLEFTVPRWLDTVAFEVAGSRNLAAMSLAGQRAWRKLSPAFRIKQ